MNKKSINTFLTGIGIIFLMLIGGCSPKGELVSIIPIDDSTNTAHLAGQVFYPAGQPEPYPVVIDMHGCSGIIESRLIDWVARLNRWGYAVIKPDSFNPRGDDNICDDLLKISPLHRLADLAGAIDYVLADQRLDSSNIFAMGMSHGATTVLLANYKPKSNFSYIKGIIAYYPYCIESMPKLIADTLILIGEDDDWTPAEYCRRMPIADKKGHSFEVIVYPNAVHSFDVQQAEQTYLGHRLMYDPKVAQDSFNKVDEFLRQRTARSAD